MNHPDSMTRRYASSIGSRMDLCSRLRSRNGTCTIGALPYVIDEFVVLAVIVELVVVIRRQYHANCSRREIINLPPYHWAYIETIVTAVQKYGYFRVHVIQEDIKRAGHSYVLLFFFFLCVF